MIKAIVPLKLMFPITSPFSVVRPTVSSWRIVANRMTSRPPRPATTIPTMTPAIPPRATSRRISPAGETAGRVSTVVVGAPVVTSGSAMARSDVSQTRAGVSNVPARTLSKHELQYTGRSFRGANGTTA